MISIVAIVFSCIAFVSSIIALYWDVSMWRTIEKQQLEINKKEGVKNQKTKKRGRPKKDNK